MLQNKTVINLCIPIEPDEYTKKFIFKNINYRRYVWNDFIEEAEKFKGDKNLYKRFYPKKFKTEYFKMEEENGIYNEYCVGISEQVMRDVDTALNRVLYENGKSTFKTSNKKKKLHKLHFKEFDRYYGSFKVHNKPEDQHNNGRISSRLHVLDRNTLTFRVRGGKGSHTHPVAEILTIHLKEPLYKYKEDSKKYPFFIREYKVQGENPVELWFNELGIKTTAFIHKLGKFYIQLSIEGSYFIKLDDIKSRQLKAGIDTGIHNPIMLYNGNEFKEYRLPDEVSKKIHYLERRAKRLQNIMDKKYTINEKCVERGELESKYTKNYEKVRRKFRKVHNKIVNIKNHWIYNTCKEIVTTYQIICVDRFKQPSHDDKECEELPNRVKRHINYTNRFHKMYIANEVLVHMANKYGCYYIKSPEKTTCTCSHCGYENEHLPLSKRFLVCKKCNTIIDRDENAAKNCYMYI